MNEPQLHQAGSYYWWYILNAHTLSISYMGQRQIFNIVSLYMHRQTYIQTNGHTKMIQYIDPYSLCLSHIDHNACTASYKIDHKVLKVGRVRSRV